MFRKQFTRFCLVGSIGFLVDASILQLIGSFTHFDLYLGRIASYLCAATCTWLMNRRFTFINRKMGYAHHEWGRYLIFNIIGGAINYGIYALCLGTLEIVHSYPAIGVGFGSVVALLVNYEMNKHWVFRTKQMIANK
jgi:putative flippase GtrA